MPTSTIGIDVGTRHLAMAAFDGRTLRISTDDLHIFPRGAGEPPLEVELQDAHLLQHVERFAADHDAVFRAAGACEIEQQMRGAGNSSTMLQLSQVLAGFLRGRYPALLVSFTSPAATRKTFNTRVLKKGTREAKYRLRKRLSVLAFDKALAAADRRRVRAAFDKVDDPAEAALLAMHAFFKPARRPRASASRAEADATRTRVLSCDVCVAGLKELALTAAEREG